MIDFHRVGTLGVIESGAGKKKLTKTKAGKIFKYPLRSQILSKITIRTQLRCTWAKYIKKICYLDTVASMFSLLGIEFVQNQ